MNSQTLIIGASAIQLIAKQNQLQLLIQNVGTNVAYLDDSTNPTTNSFPLNPGASISWNVGHECFALAPDGTTLTLSDSVSSVQASTVVVASSAQSPGVPTAPNAGASGNFTITSSFSPQIINTDQAIAIFDFGFWCQVSTSFSLQVPLPSPVDLQFTATPTWQYARLNGLLVPPGVGAPARIVTPSSADGNEFAYWVTFAVSDPGKE